jgi:hypothetical protein
MLIIPHARRAQYMLVGQGHTYETRKHHKTLRYKGSKTHERQRDRKKPEPKTPGVETRETSIGRKTY